MATSVKILGAGTVAQDDVATPLPPPLSDAVMVAATRGAARDHSAGLAVDAEEIATNARNSDATKMRHRFMINLPNCDS